MKWTVLCTTLLLVSLSQQTPASALDSALLKAPASSLAFTATGPEEFSFDTGVLRGTLRAGGKSLGLTAVVHLPTGQRLDRSNGLLSHYRVFSKGVRYGGGAWDWPSHAVLGSNGEVEVQWPSAPERPFRMQAVYRWRTANTVDVETTILPEKELAGFESFLASYFAESFTNAAVCVVAPPSEKHSADFVQVQKEFGDWQIFPLSVAALPLIHDGRWNLPPNPVAWTDRERLAFPISYRRNPVTGLTAALFAPASDSFAIAAPHQTEGHYALYFSQFGRALQPGQRASARVRMTIATDLSDQQLLQAYQAFAE